MARNINKWVLAMRAHQWWAHCQLEREEERGHSIEIDGRGR